MESATSSPKLQIHTSYSQKWTLTSLQLAAAVRTRLPMWSCAKIVIVTWLQSHLSMQLQFRARRKRASPQRWMLRQERWNHFIRYVKIGTGFSTGRLREQLGWFSPLFQKMLLLKSVGVFHPAQTQIFHSVNQRKHDSCQIIHWIRDQRALSLESTNFSILPSNVSPDNSSAGEPQN